VNLRAVELGDKFTLESGQVFVTGIQALVRLPMLQNQSDRLRELNTAGYVTGYRGSPLGALDQQLALAAEHLDQHQVQFQPAVNEDLAATAVWGTQQVGLGGDGRFDGVFAMWYGKGPGVDRSGDSLRHGNLAGSSRYGGVLVIMGDDHACESSTTAHQSEYSLINTFIPVLNPAGVQDLIDFGLYGWALSRYSGCWVGLKSVHDTVEAAASISVHPKRVQTEVPSDFLLPDSGLNLRWPDTPQEQERRLHEFKLDAIGAFVRTNPIDRRVLGNNRARTGIISTGKSYLDVRRALLELGVDEPRADALGLTLYKVGLVWPLEAKGLRQFARGLERLIVVEEKRGLIEEQVRNILYDTADAPLIIGKLDEKGDVLFPAHGRLDATLIAHEVGRRLLNTSGDDDNWLRTIVAALDQRVNSEPGKLPAMVRTPYFCAGCPHNTSTVVPAGSRALAGIGCHYMAQWMDRSTARYTQMGGEGASWIGESPFSTTEHVFQNIGDGTYFHSGLLAIRACVAAGVNITYKILYNDAVAMTGGQAMDGPMDVPRITRQVHAEGVGHIAVVTDEPAKYPRGANWAPGVSIHHRDELPELQAQFTHLRGTSVIVYDQTCAAEKRRRRHRGHMPTPARRLFINQEVCEGCGDCGVQSNCVALVPAATPVGRKRAIDQSACNMDYSCVKGFCPSFVSVTGAERKRGAKHKSLAALTDSLLLEPQIGPLERHFSIVLTGVGGTGVVTTGAIIGMAAHLAYLGCSVLDMAGLAQKGGAVTSHIVLAPKPDDINATHVADGGADLLLGCDLVTSASLTCLQKLSRNSICVINTEQMMTVDFIHDPDLPFEADALLAAIREQVNGGSFYTLAATRLAVAAFGDSIAANMVMLGMACQVGALPIPAAAIERAIELNGQSVEMNQQAFRLGRASAAQKEMVSRLLSADADEESSSRAEETTLDEVLDRYSSSLAQSHGRASARRLQEWVDKVQNAAAASAVSGETLARAVTRAGFHLLAIKDEYEVARLYSAPAFHRALANEFEGDYRLALHLAPPLLSGRDPATGRPRKRTFGPWIFPVLRVLSAMRGIRGTVLDPFRSGSERQLEQVLLSEYGQTLERLCAGLCAGNLDTAVTIAELPLAVRGFGPVKAEAAERSRERATALWPAFDNALQTRPRAA